MQRADACGRNRNQVRTKHCWIDDTSRKSPPSVDVYVSAILGVYDKVLTASE